MLLNGNIWLGTSDQGAVSLLPSMANRHGLIAGATGTGKTVTLQVLAEGFSQLGVPVFMADVKCDLAGICCPGQRQDRQPPGNLRREPFPLPCLPGHVLGCIR